MAENPVRSPEHWLQRAKDAWHHVENMRDPDYRLQMIEIAEGYERMAQRAREKRQHENPASQHMNSSPQWAASTDAAGRDRDMQS